MVVLAPIPSSSARAAARENPGFLASIRTLYRRSCQRLSMARPLVDFEEWGF